MSTPSSPKRPRKSEVVVGLADRGFSSQRRRMLDLINQLHSSGVQSDVDLPQVAVIGSQSAGKSSLIESISGIKLPRASGTCTRCPMECRLSASTEKWQCAISIRLETDKSGAALKKVQEIPFGEIIYSKDEVEDRLRRAQQAVLHFPGVPFEKFLEGSFEPSSAAQSFSSNSVCLQISGPDVADLSFVDLPGLIAATLDDKDKADIQKVEKLVTNYISRPSTVILLTVSCENDFENQGASLVARKHDPFGLRTIGVLTKPDRIEPGEGSRWLGFIKNADTKIKLKHGWFCVKQPSPAELKEKISWEEARSRETTFFATKQPWASLGFPDTQQLGTPHLMEAVSNILSVLIAKRLPDLEEETERLLVDTKKQLNELPEAMSSDPVQQLWNLVIGFDTSLHREVEGTARQDGLIQSLMKSYKAFRQSIYESAPQFCPVRQIAFAGESIPEAEFLKSENGDFMPTPTGKKVMYIDEVIARAERAISRELPDNYPYVVKRDLIEELVGKWDEPALELFQIVEQELFKRVQDLILHYFGSYTHGGLIEAVQSIVHDELKERSAETNKAIRKLLQQESTPFTINEHYLADYKAKFTSHYREVRLSARKKEQAARTSFPTAAIQPSPRQPTSAAPSPSSTDGAVRSSFREAQANSSASSSPFAFGQTSAFGGPGKPASAASTARPTEVESRSQSPTNSLAPAPGAAAGGTSNGFLAPSPMPSIADLQERTTAALAALAAAGFTGLDATDLARLLPPDRTDPAIEIMAEVRAYYQVAFKRFADNVPLAIDWDYVRAFAARVRDALVRGLALSATDAHERCIAMLEERPDVALLRSELQARKERLSAAVHALRDMRVRNTRGVVQ